MNCPNCGAPVSAGHKFCMSCGSAVNTLTKSVEQNNSYSQANSYAQSKAYPDPYPSSTSVYVGNVITEDTLPERYRPLSPWAYFGYDLLYAIPLIGFIFLLIHAFSDSNINRRNFARSFFCAFLIAVIIVIVLAATGASLGILDYLDV